MTCVCVCYFEQQSEPSLGTHTNTHTSQTLAIEDQGNEITHRIKTCTKLMKKLTLIENYQRPSDLLTFNLSFLYGV